MSSVNFLRSVQQIAGDIREMMDNYLRSATPKESLKIIAKIFLGAIVMQVASILVSTVIVSFYSLLATYPLMIIAKIGSVCKNFVTQTVSHAESIGSNLSAAVENLFLGTEDSFSYRFLSMLFAISDETVRVAYFPYIFVQSAFGILLSPILVIPDWFRITCDDSVGVVQSLLNSSLTKYFFRPLNMILNLLPTKSQVPDFRLQDYEPTNQVEARLSAIVAEKRAVLYQLENEALRQSQEFIEEIVGPVLETIAEAMPVLEEMVEREPNLKNNESFLNIFDKFKNNIKNATKKEEPFEKIPSYLLKLK